MSTAFYRTETGQERSPVRRRAISLALAVAIEVLLILAFLTLDFMPKRPEFEGGTLSTFDLPASADEAAATKAQKPAQDTPRPTKPVRPPLKPKIILPERPLDLLPLSRDELEAADISKLGTNVPGAALAQGNDPSGNVPGDSRLVGTTPNGEPLYAAEWYREPTHQELSTYLPKNMPENGGWGMVACKTADRYRVTDCVELGNSPPGSHLAGAVRQAAWQFLVRPPRIGGKPMIGEWVRIQITYQMITRREGEAMP